MDSSINNETTGQTDQEQPSTDSDMAAAGSNTDTTTLETDEMESSDPTGMDGEDMASLMEMYEESFKRFAEGEVVKGRIISVDKDHVLVDIGYKSEGQIRIQ